MLVIAFTNAASAQKNIVSVNQPTGTANVVIPITAISNGAVTAPVSLVYSATGVKLKDVEGLAGIGWQLQAGGMVTRTVRGLPDEITQDNQGNARLGWLHNSNSAAISSFSITNVNNTSCTNESADVANLNASFGNLSDTEPDLFSVSAPGLNCQFVFDGSQIIRTIPYMDVKIVPEFDSSTGLIKDFIVTNDKGIKYTFNVALLTQKKTSLYNGDPFAVEPTEPNIKYFRNHYFQYKYGIQYNSAWYLKTITDPNGNQINFEYGTDTQKDSMTPTSLYIGSSATASTDLYYEYETDHPSVLNSIDNGSQYCTIQFNTNTFTNYSSVNSITCNNIVYQLNYSSVAYTAPSRSVYNRFFLRDVSTADCNSPVKYHFDYNGETLTSGVYTTILPDSLSTQYDAWGYYNNGATGRAANATSVVAGALSKITYYDNGNTSLVYEPNDYYNGGQVLAGGIRIKQITDNDGISTANDIVRNYSYLDPSTGNTSGKPITLPQYTFNRPDTDPGSGSSDAIISSDLDMSEDDHTIMYTNVKVSQTGAGYSTYQYAAPGTYLDTTGDFSWAPVIDYIGRANCTDGLGYAANQAYGYPFAPAVNFDFERGLLMSVKSYTDAGNEVSESSYSYTTTNSPVVITGLRYDLNNYATSYAKYNIYATTSKLVSQVTSKTFDPSPATTYQQSTLNYTYGSTAHKLATQTQTTNSDGSVTTLNVKYTKDYDLGGGSSPLGLFYLQQENINIPVEQYTQVQLPGASALTTSAGLTLFAQNGVNFFTQILPSKQLKFVSAGGVSDFTPSSASGGTFTYDSRYVITSNMTLYDFNGIPRTFDDNNKHQRTIISDAYTHTPVAVFDNAASTDVTYTHFETLFSSSRLNGSVFFKDNNVYTYGTTSGRSFAADQYLSLEASATLSTATMTVNSNSANDVFSIWINASSSGNITINLTGANSTVSSKTIAFGSTGGSWKYCEAKIPVSGLGGSFTASFSSDAAVNIDDILLYPEHANTITTVYDHTNGHNLKVSQTNTNGIAEYYTNDNLGRVILVSDKDHNVKLRNSFNAYDPAVVLPDPTFVIFGIPSLLNSGWVTGTTIQFYNVTNYSACALGTVTYTWDFGDGSGTYTTTSQFGVTHAYSTAATYTVTCQVSATGFAAKTTSNPITVVALPPPPPPSVTIATADNTGLSGFTSATFYDGTNTYTINAVDLSNATGTVPPGSYTITVNAVPPTSPGTYGSFGARSDDGQTYCAVRNTGHDRYMFTMNLTASTYLTFSIYTGTTCP